jgi:hypothetical protein
MTGVQDRWRFASQRSLEMAVGVIFAGYVFYVLMLGKLFSRSVSPPWYRDLGMLWDLADYTINNRNYHSGQLYPPSTAIIAHLFGLLDRDIAFRIYFVVQVIAIGSAIWAWTRLIGLDRSPSRSLVILTAALTCFFYIHGQLTMHNTNAETFALISLALTWQPRTQLSAGCYALSLAVKPFSAVFILPWMAWNGYRAWVVSALVWLLGFYVLLPVMWFGVSDAIELHREWLATLLSAVDNNDPNQLSVRSGLAALVGAPLSNPEVNIIALLLEAIWLGALTSFFVPTLLRRGAPAAMVGACEAAAILLIGLPLGSYTQPARSITLLASTLIIASAVFDSRQSPGSRVVLAAILVVIGVSAQVVPLGPVFSLMTLPVCLLALAGLAIVRRMPTWQKADATNAGRRLVSARYGTPTR